MHSYGAHWAAARERRANLAFTNPLEFLEHAHRLGAGGVQVGLGALSGEPLSRFRDKAEQLRMYFEGQLSLPRDESDVTRFEAEVRAAKQAGASVLRTAMLSGRRYETFDSADAFRLFRKKSWASLTLAEPVVKKQAIRLAVENHKDWRIPELLEIMRRMDSEFVGVCVDTGNSIALLEDPMSTVEALAPFAVSTHLKDMAVQEMEGGFLLSEVPLGEGFLDLKAIVSTLRKAAPNVRFNLEMITRDPLKVPCLTEKYWVTLDEMPAFDLAKMLRLVRRHEAKKPLPRTTGLSAEEKLKLENDNVRKSIEYARTSLEL
jgi:sugar phosphate isomerase/epimerase